MAALKKGSKAAKDFMAKIRAAKGKTKPKKVGATKIIVEKKQTGGSNRAYDKYVQALPSGKRKTAKTHYANGKKITHSTIYTETRKNRSDKGKLLGIPTDNRVYITNLYLKNLNELKKLDNNFIKLKNLLKDPAYKSQKEQIKKQVILFASLIKENKTHLKELKKLI